MYHAFLLLTCSSPSKSCKMLCFIYSFWYKVHSLFMFCVGKRLFKGNPRARGAMATGLPSLPASVRFLCWPGVPRKPRVRFRGSHPPTGLHVSWRGPWRCILVRGGVWPPGGRGGGEGRFREARLSPFQPWGAVNAGPLTSLLTPHAVPCAPAQRSLLLLCVPVPRALWADRASSEDPGGAPAGCVCPARKPAQGSVLRGGGRRRRETERTVCLLPCGDR